MKRAFPRNKIALLLALTLILASFLCSCGGNMTEDDVKKELERLLPLSYELNEIFWGKGLEYQNIESADRYLPVKDDCPYKNTQQILDKAAEVFSAEYLAIIKDAIFTDSEDIDPRYMDVNGVLKADKTKTGFDIKGNVLIETSSIKKQTGASVTVTAEYEDGGNIEITLVLRDGKWYLNGPTY